MVRGGASVSSHMLHRLLRGCIVKKDVEVGRQVHALAVKSGFEADMFLGNHIIRMYASGGCLVEANQVFSRIAAPDSHVWSSIISAHVDNGAPGKAIELYELLRRSTVEPNERMYVAALRACTKAADLTSGRLVHGDVKSNGYEASAFVGSTLVDMYAKCGRLEDARCVFDRLSSRNVVTWSAMIAGYVKHGRGREAVELYLRMRQCGMIPDKVTYVCVLKACGSIGALQEGKQIHCQIVEGGLESDACVGSSLVDMYAKCGSLKDSRQVFDSLPIKDVRTWNAMIAGYMHQGLGQEALQFYDRMRQSGTVASAVTFVRVLKACGIIGAMQEGKRICTEILERGLESNLFVGSALVDMFAKCGNVEDARRIFDALPAKNIVSWNTMISGYAQNGFGPEALKLFATMQRDGAVKPDNVTLVTMLQLCGSIGAIQEGRQMHSQILEMGLDADVFVGSTLVDMYARCGNLKDARRVFDSLSQKDVVIWTAMIAAYVQHGLGQEALQLYLSMQQDGMLPNTVTFVSVIKACGSVGAIQEGKQIHAEIAERELETNVWVGNALVDMYAKCGSLEDAQAVFDRMSTRDVVTWTSLINGYGQHNECGMAIQLFETMQQQGFEPNAATFTALLVACSHVGRVEEGQKYFKMMVEHYGMSPTLEHFTCMVDLLGRSGRLDEAENLLQTMPLQPDSVGWMSLLNACKFHGNVELGRLCFDRLRILEPQFAGGYVLMSSLYAGAGRRKDVDKIEKMRKHAGAQKKPAKAFIEVNSKVHEFTVGEMSTDISAKLSSLNERLKEAGHVPDTDLILKRMSEKEKEDALCGHAEKLAIAFGLLNTPEGTTLLVTKNLRMCNDCHNGSKVLSKMEGREIIVRDAHRVHHFKGGLCSCGDYH